MKRAKKLMTMVLVMVVTIAAITPFQGKVSKAADYSSAAPVLLNGTWSSDYYLTETDSEHWYKIIIPKDGELEIKFMSYFDELRWELWNSDLSEKLRYTGIWGLEGSESSPKTEMYKYILSAGTYYFKLYAGDSLGKYKMYYQYLDYGLNDETAYSYDSPQNYQIGSVINGAITMTDREDWYKITIPSDGYYTQKIVSYFKEVYWDLYNSDLSKRIHYTGIWGVEGSETSPKTETYDWVLSKGVYYVKITGESSGKYQFQMTKLTPDTCTHDYEKTWHDATYFAKGYRSYQCKKCGHSYKGDYEPVKKLGQSYVNQYGSSVGKGKIKLSWGTVSDASGYQIRYSKKGNMKNGKTISVKGQSKSKKTIKKLSRRKKYFIQVRAYKKSKGKTVYGKWSQKKSFRTK